MQYELGFIGGGNMAEAIVRAAIRSDVVQPAAIGVSDPVADRRAVFESVGAAAFADNVRIATDSRQVVLAVKPQRVHQLADALAAINAEKQIVISIMAGLTCAVIEQAAGKALRLIRVMPNTPLLIGQGMSAVAAGPHARPGDQLLAIQLFGAAGKVIEVDESLLDAVTAVSGSGPAYLFFLAEAMNQAARQLNLNETDARLLTNQTLLGAAELLSTSGETAADLRAKVTSPGGTTQAAVEHLDSSDVLNHIVTAIHKAAQRSRELGTTNANDAPQ